MQRRNDDDELEQIMRQAVQRQQRSQDDINIQAVEHNGREQEIIRRQRDIQFIPAPDGEGSFPITVSRTKYRLDDNGLSFGKIANVGSCKFGCWVRADSLFTCNHCKKNTCQRHTLTAGSCTYCRQKPCILIGRAYQAAWTSYRAVRLCLASVLGLSPLPGGEEQSADSFTFEHDLFTPTEKRVDLNAAERGDGT